jgi:heavy metal sensor kinase
MFNPIRMSTKLTLWYTGVLALALALFSGGVHALMQRKLAGRMDENLRAGIEAMTRFFIHEKAEGETDQNSARSVLRESHFHDQAVAFYDSQGSLLAEQPLRDKLHARLPDSFTERADNGVQFSTLAAAQSGIDDGLRVAAYRITAPSMKTPCFVVISEPLTELLDDLELLRDIFYIAAPVALALAGLGGWFLARKSLSPVAEISERARRIGADNLDERLPVANSRDELGQMAATFNELLGRLSRAFAQQQQFMADASHELRTPVSVIRTASEATLAQPVDDVSEYREALAVTGEQARRLTRIIEDMFLLARADAGKRELRPGNLYLDELVAEAARAAGVLAERKGVSVECSPAPETPYRGDEDLLWQMLLNLLDNAIKYTPAGGKVSLGLARTGANHVITVADTGAGIPVEAQPYVFERFYRADKARERAEAGASGGSGLGLPIARWIAEAHGGQISLGRSDLCGSAFVITLPVRRQSFGSPARSEEQVSVESKLAGVVTENIAGCASRLPPQG